MAYNRRKRKVKKNIPEAQAHIHSTYNNTVISITDVVESTITGKDGIGGIQTRGKYREGYPRSVFL